MGGHLKDRYAPAVHSSLPLIFPPFDLSAHFRRLPRIRPLALWCSVSNHINHMNATANCNRSGASAQPRASSLVLIRFAFSPSAPFLTLFLSPPSLLTSPLPRLGSGISGWCIYSELVPRRRCLLVHYSISSPICFQVPGLQNTSRSLKSCCAQMFFKGPDPLGRFFLSLCGVMTQTCRQGKDASEI